VVDLDLRPLGDKIDGLDNLFDIFYSSLIN
jgi:hypothetical protein